MGLSAERHHREPHLAREPLGGAGQAARRRPAAAAALGRLSPAARLPRILAGAAKPPARPRGLHAHRRPMDDGKARPLGIADYARAARESVPLSPTELLGTLREALAPWEPGTPFWIFAYGSLMWNPKFAFDAKHVATIRGYHRSFRLWSRVNRGTPDNPGLVLTLECGGSCRGLVYRIAPDLVQEQLQLIWKREMLYGSYRPKWLNCVVGDETIRALCFTVNR